MRSLLLEALQDIIDYDASLEKAKDHEFDLDIKWDEKHNWMDKNLDFVMEEDANKYKEKLNEVRNLSNNKEDAHVGYDKLNAEQKLAHDMILEACRNRENGIKSCI